MYLNRILGLGRKWAQPSQLASLLCLICIWFSDTFYTWHLGVVINDQNVVLKFLNESGCISTMSKYFNEFVIFSLSASILYIVNSSAQHETPIPLNFIEQLNKNELSSKKRTKLKYEHKEQFCKPCCGSMQGCLGAYGALFTPLVQATPSWHVSVSRKDITTGYLLISCVACIIAAVYVCTGKSALESTPCAQSLTCKHRNRRHGMLSDFLAPLLRLPEELSAFPIH